MLQLKMIKNKLYVLIDKTLKPVYGCVQGGHAVAQWMLEHKYSRKWENEYLIYLRADVKQWKRRLELLGIDYSVFMEPDLDNKITAIAVHGHEELFKNLDIVTED